MAPLQLAATLRRGALVLLAGLVLVPATARAQTGVFPFLQPPDFVALDGAALDAVGVLDYDGDGVPDIALAGPQRLELIRGLPDGWAPARSIALPWSHVTIATGELTGDRYDDIVIASTTGSVALARGRGDGMLTAPATGDTYALKPTDGSYVAGWHVSLALGDVDGDGSPDVAAGFEAGTSGTSSVEVLANDAHGGLTKAASLPSSDPEDVLLTPLGGDADLDLVVAAGAPLPDPTGRVEVFPGGAGASFGPPTTYRAGEGVAAQIADLDFNGDQATDIVVGLSNPNSVFGAAPTILPGTPSRPTLGAPTSLSAAPDAGTAVASGDVNRDGRDDVLVINWRKDMVYTLLGTPPATFTMVVGIYYYRNEFRSWMLADADGDDKVDLIMVQVPVFGGTPQLDFFYGSGPTVMPPAPVVDFGTVALGTSSAPQTGRFTNVGPGSADGLTVLSSGDIDDFVLDGGDCPGAALDVGESCTMTAHFHPTALGDRELDVAMVAPDSDYAWWTPLVGIGANPPAAPGPTPTPTSTPARTPTPTPVATPRAAKISAAARARIVKRRRLDTGWKIACPARGQPCRVSVLAVARAKAGKKAPVLARTTVTVPAGKTRRIIVPLTTAGRRAHKPLRAVIKLRATRTGATPVTVQKTVTLRR